MSVLCPKCGASNADNASFCTSCGERILLTEPNKQSEASTMSENQKYYSTQTVNSSPAYSNNYSRKETTKDEMSVGQFLLYIFLFSIPVVGLILAIVFSCTESSGKIKKNFARGMLIWKAIVLVLSMLWAIFTFSVVVRFFSENKDYFEDFAEKFGGYEEYFENGNRENSDFFNYNFDF